MISERANWGLMGPGVYEQVTLEFGSGAKQIEVEQKEGDGEAQIKGNIVIIPDGMTADVSWSTGITKQYVEVRDWRKKLTGRGGDAYVNFPDRASVHLRNDGDSQKVGYHELKKASYKTTVFPEPAEEM